MAFLALPEMAQAQSYRFNSVSVEGNKRIETGTILSYAGIARGQTVSAAELNDAYQRVLGSGLFETVTMEPRGSRLDIRVNEYPTINRISFEGNKRLKDKDLAGFIKSKSRLVFNPTQAERDAETIAEAYNQNGRLGARVNPKIIRRSENRVDLVFEIFEGGNVEVQRIGFVGNKAFSDGRLRRVLETKQAGLLRALIKKDTFVEDRLQFDQQVLRDFYLSRGYVDFRITNTNAELARDRNGYFLTFNVEEGQQFRFGEITTTSEMDGVDADEFQKILKVRPGIVYSPSHVERSIARMEQLASKKGIDFLRVQPKITRNDRDLTLDVDFVLTKGPRIFVERIDIQGNATTLDRVVRRQFKTAEGDPFNPRDIREAAERIRALGFFSKADVEAREGSSPQQVVVGVNVEEAPTGSLSFGGTYSTKGGLGLVLQFSEKNFLGRGQEVKATVSGATDNRNYGLYFAEPAFLGRDVKFIFDIGYYETDNYNALYDTSQVHFSPSLEFPISENARFGINYKFNRSDINHYTGAGAVIGNEQGRGLQDASSIGYSFSYDTRRSGFNPDAGVLLEFGQDFAGAGGDLKFSRSKARAVAQTKVLNGEVTLRASLAGGVIQFRGGGSSRVTERFLYDDDIIRGFQYDGIGPREYLAGTVNDALGGNMFATARFEAEFPLGLPEEYGIHGGLFYDIGNVWGLDAATKALSGNIEYANGSARHVAGISIFWKTPVGPLRLNWTKALKKEPHDVEQQFELTISADF
ncbi:outer membrane protein assembly factor BamA [Aquicoccus sp. G2-2]|uniref:outer membrane protein assembly factor BamA n=1 Tax=Aquicoccus sp. G2-2 TaxID=3092120 RepID=UPI002ADFF91E|nr:outer membrane protein assembly factor BamA [Aquicoccus sp. G2-2]MEA1113041.1 outer membrane protein assembly factor BamA [Aquicoccus sp. G2-2]